jgi:ribosomal protein S12 methylthiotransferase accessory factor
MVNFPEIDLKCNAAITSHDGNCAGRLLDLPALCETFGITRVGSYSGLDVINVPVWFAVRPNSRSLSVAQGKGLTTDQAKLSAIMESIEGAVAERGERIVDFKSDSQAMADSGATLLPFERLSACAFRRPEATATYELVLGKSLRNGAAVAAPYELVGTDFRVDAPWNRNDFQMSSVGLACGLTLPQALLHGLCEIVENDASSLVEFWPSLERYYPRIDVARFGSAVLGELLEHVRQVGFNVEFTDLTQSAALPVVKATIFPGTHACDTQYLMPAAGYACRFTVEDAALAAVLEAIQTRSAEIAGARDDIEENAYSIQSGASLGALQVLRERATSCLAGDSNLSAATDAEKLRFLATRLFETGVEDIFAFSLNSPCPAIKTVRVITTDLLEVSALSRPTIAPRAARQLAALMGGPCQR